MAFPAILAGIKGLLSGDGLVAKGLDFINDRWPPDMSEGDRKQMEIVVKDMLHQQQLELMNAARQDEQAFNERTVQLEGTAGDLKAIPYVGGLIIFMRGAFRPLFSYMTMYIDYLYFVQDTTGWTDRQEALLLAINLLVLVFFFGERAMRNVMPLILQMFSKEPNHAN
jgi:hypothetical protein